MSHTCHARGCNVPVPPKMLMCSAHWRKVPRDLQRSVWAHYRSGQEVDKNPTMSYLDAADAAIKAVAKKELKKPRASRQTNLFGGVS